VAFRGWPVGALEFFEGLAADNTKAYWTANKASYEQLVRAPMVELLAELEPEFGSGRIFRPYRDVRFSADKSPFKTEIAAVLEGDGYVRLSASGLGAGCGMWMMETEHLERYRQAVADEESGTELEAVVAALRGRGIQVGGESELKSAPRGYPRDHPRVELLRHKGLAAFQQWPAGAWLGTVAAKKRIVDFLHATRPLHNWLERHVGAATHEAH